MKRWVGKFIADIRGNFLWSLVCLFASAVLTALARFRNSLTHLPPDAYTYGALFLVSFALFVWISWIAIRNRSAGQMPTPAAPRTAEVAVQGNLHIEILEGYVGWVPDVWIKGQGNLPEMYLLLKLRVAPRTTSLSVKNWAVTYSPATLTPATAHGTQIVDIPPLLTFAPKLIYNEDGEEQNVGASIQDTTYKTPIQLGSHEEGFLLVTTWSAYLSEVFRSFVCVTATDSLSGESVATIAPGEWLLQAKFSTP